MKKMYTLMLMTAIAITANAMPYNEAKNEALFLSDKMAYELNLTDDQYAAVYEINLDYLMCVNGVHDVNGPWWNRRNTDLKYVLTPMQYNRFLGLPYFYRPLVWNADRWTLVVHNHYIDRGKFFKPRPHNYAHYKGGNNHRPANHYAAKHPTPKGNGPTWRVTHNNKPGTWRR